MCVMMLRYALYIYIKLRSKYVMISSYVVLRLYSILCIRRERVILLNKFLFDSSIKTLTILLLICWILPAQAAINIVAAENMYGSVAQEIGGDNVNVTSILNNPNQDPHLFSASPSTARAVAQANIIVYNGIAYDPWMEKLLSVQSNSSKTVIVVANLVGAKMGDNPHLWYKPNTMPIYAQDLATILQQQDPTHKDYYAKRLAAFQQQYQILNNKIANIRQHYQGTAVIATEPLFGYLAQALGLQMLAIDFQINVMNDVEPSPSQLREFEQALNSHTAHVLFYNQQVISPLTQQMQAIATHDGIPIVGVTETQPENISYVQWMLNQLTATEQALHANIIK